MHDRVNANECLAEVGVYGLLDPGGLAVQGNPRPAARSPKGQHLMTGAVALIDDV